MPRDRVQKAIETRVIEIAPLAYMRGRTLSDAFVILDEAQNATGMQMKMFLTRLGVNSRAVITGDKTQIDLANREDSGLLQVERILPGIEGIGFCYLSDTDVVRHRLEVVFEELVSNTIRHGFTRDSDQSIHVRIEPKPGLVEFTFEDDGTPFNPLEVEPPAPFKSIETARIGGLGISLVVKLSAHLSYERLAPHTGQPGFAPRNRLVVAIAT